jgi:hypothetical protein
MTVIKLLVETCGRCGGQVVGDNMGNGRPWQHVDRADDHHVIFGTPAPPGIVEAPSSALDMLEDILEDTEVTLPPPGASRSVHDDELGGPRTGTRQMVNAAIKAGFDLDLSIARGPSKIAAHHDPRGYRPTERLLVGFRHGDGRRAVGVWERSPEDDEPKFAFVLAFCAGTTGGLKSSAELKTYLKSPR